jgi:hypothetical protein
MRQLWQDFGYAGRMLRGFGAALALARFPGGPLYEAGANDPTTFKVEPMEALRHE